MSRLSTPMPNLPEATELCHLQQFPRTHSILLRHITLQHRISCNIINTFYKTAHTDYVGVIGSQSSSLRQVLMFTAP